MNHMMAHKNDRPHICNLCGARYIRRTDLLNHLKIHAQIPEQELEDIKVFELLKTPQMAPVSRKTSAKGRRTPKTKPPRKAKKPRLLKPKREYIEDDEPAAAPERSDSPETEQYPIIDPSRPFVCQKCGVSFAREKALMSHAKVIVVQRICHTSRSNVKHYCSVLFSPPRTQIRCIAAMLHMNVIVALKCSTTCICCESINGPIMQAVNLVTRSTNRATKKSTPIRNRTPSTANSIVRCVACRFIVRTC